jgi:BTB/POZ domain
MLIESSIPDSSSPSLAVDGSPSEFFVHKDAIIQLSKPLFTLMKGELSEAQAGCTTWEDVSKGTFERLVQFAYTGDYSIPKTEKRKRVVKLEKADISVPAHPASPIATSEEKNGMT